ncbi:hypothetical protein KGM_210379 [Danaus plexippus plexippus]|uniref:Uncharacterized protein n=1 Tax=Danaus plexippus plexippus TaxID=278856 RepID=A0A212ESG9_DANPL|nr:hypothetical protein KGM_210379 [Danaus plexippus plexippus]
MILKYLLLFIRLSVNAINSTNITIPSLDAMFKSLSEDLLDDYPSNLVVKKLSIDLEKLDMNNITRKLEVMRRNLNDSDDTGALEEFNTRRLGTHGSAWQRNRAIDLLERVKVYDIMLQLIYQARHKVKQIESEKYYNSKDTSYRIAFLYRRLRRIWKRMHDIYTTMKLNKYENNKHRGKFQVIETYLILHHKAAKLHVEFLYMWWVLIKLHEKYHFRHNAPNTTPKQKYIW